MAFRGTCSRLIVTPAFLALCSIFLIQCLIPGSVLAEKWLLAEEKDKEIRKVLATALPIAEEQFEQFDSDVALVVHQLIIDAADGTYDEYRNDIWWVRRGEAEHITNYVRDFDPGVQLKKVKAFLIRPGSFDGQAALKAKIVPLGKDRIRIQKGDGKQRATNLVIGFDTAQPGDLLGVSIQLEIQESLYWRPWQVARSEPVARAELRVINGKESVYNVFGNRFKEGAVQKEVLKEVNGQARDLRLWAESIDPIVHEPYSPPGFIQSPSFLVAERAERFNTGGGRWAWWYLKHWNQVASRMASSETRYFKEIEKADEQAEKLTAGLSPAESADALYIFVRDELLYLSSSYFFKKNSRHTVDEILEARAGSSFERAFLLLAMLRSRDLTAEIVWTHDPGRGAFFRNYPNWGQVSVPLIRVTQGKKTILYDLGCPECAPGTVRQKFVGSRALSYLSDSDELSDTFIDNVYKEAWARNLDPFQFYMRTIERENWCELFMIPGDPSHSSGWTEEKICFEEISGSSPTAIFQIRSGGLTAIRKEADRSGDPESAATGWALDRFDSAREDTVLAVSQAKADTLDVTLRLECGPIGEPMGDTWILPAEVVWGEPSIGPWPVDRVTPFNVSVSNDRHWEFRIPLPEGWERVVVPEDRKLGFKLMYYNLNFQLVKGQFVVRRSLLERVGTVDDPKSVTLIGKEASAIREIETSPLVLRRAGG